MDLFVSIYTIDKCIYLLSYRCLGNASWRMREQRHLQLPPHPETCRKHLHHSEKEQGHFVSLPLISPFSKLNDRPWQTSQQEIRRRSPKHLGTVHAHQQETVSPSRSSTVKPSSGYTCHEIQPNALQLHS